LRYTISIILILLISIPLFSQSEDSLKLDFRGIRAGVDGFGLIRSAVKPGFTGVEFTGEIDMKKLIVGMDIGRATQRIDSLPGYLYSNKGNYFRIGVENNFIYKDEDGSVISVTLRYGRAKFNDELTYRIEDPLLGTYEGLVNNNDKLGARWFEFGVGMKAAILKNFWMGYRATWKFGLKVDDGEFIPLLVPGYGPSRTPSDGNTWWGFQYYFMLGIGK